MLRLGGRVVIFDKFLPEGQALSPLRRCLGWLIRSFGTDPNRRLGEILAGCPGLLVGCDQPSLLGGPYRLVLVEKARLEEGSQVSLEPAVLRSE